MTRVLISTYLDCRIRGNDFWATPLIHAETGILWVLDQCNLA